MHTSIHHTSFCRLKKRVLYPYMAPHGKDAPNKQIKVKESFYKFSTRTLIQEEYTFLQQFCRSLHQLRHRRGQQTVSGTAQKSRGLHGLHSWVSTTSVVLQIIIRDVPPLRRFVVVLSSICIARFFPCRSSR